MNKYDKLSNKVRQLLKASILSMDLKLAGIMLLTISGL
jgi:hypothetical protein